MADKLMFFQDAMDDVLKRHQEEIEFTKAHEPLFRTAMEYGLKFSKNENHPWGSNVRAANTTYIMGIGTINCVALNLYLGETDTIPGDVAPILDELMDHPRLKFTGEREYVDAGWKGWNFKLVDPSKQSTNGTAPMLLVRAFFEASTKCKKVGTGEFEEKMKVVCE